MRKLQRPELEKFFHDLEKWNRVVVKDAHGSAVDHLEQTEKSGQDQATERQLFIRVGCDTELGESKPDAELA